MSEDLSVILGRLKVEINNLVEQYRTDYKLPGYILVRAFTDELIRLKDLEIMEAAVQIDKLKTALRTMTDNQTNEGKEQIDGQGVSQSSGLEEFTEQNDSSE